MHAAPVPLREWPAAAPECRPARPVAPETPRTTLHVECVGHLVPTLEFDALVHSVFARACNIAHGDGLLTLVHHRLADGPTTLRLPATVTTDFRLLARAGDRWRCRDGIVVARNLALDLTRAVVWRPAPAPAGIDAPEARARLRIAADVLSRWRGSHSSVIDREGEDVVARLRDACRRLDIAEATRHVARLAGWGEGLTPAGDDVLVGFRAALGPLVGGRGDRARFLLKLSAAMTVQAQRTTPIAAHLLRLAVRGHFNADVVHLVDALLGAGGRASLADSLFAALDSGATSGADMVTGMIAGLTAWTGADADSQRPPGRAAITGPLQ